MLRTSLNAYRLPMNKRYHILTLMTKHPSWNTTQRAKGAQASQSPMPHLWHTPMPYGNIVEPVPLTSTFTLPRCKSVLSSQNLSKAYPNKDGSVFCYSRIWAIQHLAWKAESGTQMDIIASMTICDRGPQATQHCTTTLLVQCLPPNQRPENPAIFNKGWFNSSSECSSHKRTLPHCVSQCLVVSDSVLSMPTLSRTYGHGLMPALSEKKPLPTPFWKKTTLEHSPLCQPQK